MFDLIIIGFVAISVAAFVATEGKKDETKNPPKTTIEENIK